MISAPPLRWFSLLLFSALIHQTSSGLFSVKVQSPVSGLLGSSVSLPCVLENNLDARHLEVLWYRPKLHNTPALFYKDTQIQKNPVDVQYQGRVFLLGDLEKGDVSMKLENLTLADRGDYVCHVKSDNWYDKATVSLRVKVVGSTPVLSLHEAGEGKINVSCQSHGWLPEPSVIWTDKDGRDLKHLSKDKLTSNTEGLVDVSSWMIVSPSDWISCSVGLSGQERKESRTALFIPAESGNGYLLIPIVLLLCAAAAGITVYCVLRKKGVISKEKQRGTAEGTLSETEPLNQVCVEIPDENDSPPVSKAPDGVVKDTGGEQKGCSSLPVFFTAGSATTNPNFIPNPTPAACISETIQTSTPSNPTPPLIPLNPTSTSTSSGPTLTINSSKPTFTFTSSNPTFTFTSSNTTFTTTSSKPPSTPPLTTTPANFTLTTTTLNTTPDVPISETITTLISSKPTPTTTSSKPTPTTTSSTPPLTTTPSNSTLTTTTSNSTPDVPISETISTSIPLKPTPTTTSSTPPLTTTPSNSTPNAPFSETIPTSISLKPSPTTTSSKPTPSTPPLTTTLSNSTLTTTTSNSTPDAPISETIPTSIPLKPSPTTTSSKPTPSTPPLTTTPSNSTPDAPILETIPTSIPSKLSPNTTFSKLTPTTTSSTPSLTTTPSNSTLTTTTSNSTPDAPISETTSIPSKPTTTTTSSTPPLTTTPSNSTPDDPILETKPTSITSKPSPNTTFSKPTPTTTSSTPPLTTTSSTPPLTTTPSNSTPDAPILETIPTSIPSIPTHTNTFSDATPSTNPTSAASNSIQTSASVSATVSTTSARGKSSKFKSKPINENSTNGAERKTICTEAKKKRKNYAEDTESSSEENEIITKRIKVEIRESSPEPNRLYEPQAAETEGESEMLVDVDSLSVTKDVEMKDSRSNEDDSMQWESP